MERETEREIMFVYLFILLFILSSDIILYVLAIRF